MFIIGRVDFTDFMETTSGWISVMPILLPGAIACMVQLFFSRRLHILGNRLWLTIFIATCSMCTLVGSLGLSVTFLLRNNPTIYGRSKPFACLLFFSSAVADVTITLAMTYSLRRYRAGGYDATNRVLDSVIQRESLPFCGNFVYVLLVLIVSHRAEWFHHIISCHRGDLSRHIHGMHYFCCILNCDGLPRSIANSTRNFTSIPRTRWLL